MKKYRCNFLDHNFQPWSGVPTGYIHADTPEEAADRYFQSHMVKMSVRVEWGLASAKIFRPIELKSYSLIQEREKQDGEKYRKEEVRKKQELDEKRIETLFAMTSRLEGNSWLKIPKNERDFILSHYQELAEKFCDGVLDDEEINFIRAFEKTQDLALGVKLTEFVVETRQFEAAEKSGKRPSRSRMSAGMMALGGMALGNMIADVHEDVGTIADSASDISDAIGLD